MLGFVAVLALAAESQALVARRGSVAAPRRVGRGVSATTMTVGRRVWLRTAAVAAPGVLVFGAVRPSNAAAPAGAPAFTAIAGAWTISQEARFEGVPARADVDFLKSGEVRVTFESDVAMSSADFIIESKRGSRTVKWQTDYPSATLVYEGVVDDAIPGEMTGDVFELSDRGGAGTKAGTFTLKQVSSVEPKASVLFAKPMNLKPGDDLGGKERWVYNKEKAKAAAAAETAAVRAKNEALMARLGCSTQASCADALKAEAR